MSGSDEAGPRTYGHWRRPQSAGLLHLGSYGTLLLLAGLIVTVVVMMTGHTGLALVCLAVLAVVLAVTAIRDVHGRSLLARAATRMNWRRAAATGANVYRSGPAGLAPWGSHQLPGIAAASRLWEFVDSLGRPFALLQLPSVGHFTVVFGTEPDGAALVDSEQVDSWVADWGAWLAMLGEEPGIVGVAVTVETAPDTGSRLAAEIADATDAAAPDFARQLLADLVTTYPAGSATVRAFVSITFSAAARPGGKWRKPDEIGRELATRIPGLGQALSATGAGAARPLTGRELCEAVRVAYDPTVARVVDEARLEQAGAFGTDWADVGPAATHTLWDSYRHDSGLSVTWQMTGAPRGLVQSGVLSRLLAPHRDIARKRVTWLYRPIDAGRAAAIVEADLRNVAFNNTQTVRATARDQVSEHAARVTASEEAAGAGLVNFGALVTATVTDPSRLPDARAAVDTLAATARLRLRPVYGGQDTAFAAALPLGIVLTSHHRIPANLRDKWE